MCYVDCMRSVADFYFQFPWILLISYTLKETPGTRQLFQHDDDVDYETGIIKLLQERHLLEIFNNTNAHKNFQQIVPPDKARQIVILFTLQEQFNHSYVQDWKRHRQWFGQAKILIFLLCHDSVRITEISAVIFNELWLETGAVNVMIAALVKDDLTFYTWFPYTGNCQVEPVVVGECPKSFFISTDRLFTNKTPQTTNLNGCPFKVSGASAAPYVYEDFITGKLTDGIEVELMNTVAMKLNLTLVYDKFPTKDVPWREFDKDDQPDGLLKWVYLRRIDAMFMGVPLNIKRHFLVDYVHSYYQDEEVWVVPLPRKLSKWINVFRPFQPIVWGLLLILHVAVGVLLYFLSERLKQLTFWVLTTLGLNLNQSGKFTSKRLLFRLFLAIYLLFLININASYQCAIIKLLTGSYTEKPLATPVEAYEKGLTLRLYPSQLNDINQTDHEVWNQLLKRINITLDILTNFKETIYRHDQYFLFSWAKASFLILSRYTTLAGKPLLTYLPQRLSSQNPVISLQKDHPLTPIIQKQVRAIREGGLTLYWLKNCMVQAFQQARNTTEVSDWIENDEILDGLRFEELSGAFIAWCCGSVLSLFVFFAEIVFSKIYLKQK